MKKQTTPVRYGTITGIFLIVYFILLGALGLITSPIYSVVNAFICAVGIFMAISKASEQDDFTYEKGFKTGLMTGVYGTIIFTAFFAVFGMKSEGLVADLIQSIEIINLNYGLLLLTVAVLGLISVYVVTLILMKAFKHSFGLVHE